jgi:small subunit ribosomal protein S3
MGQKVHPYGFRLGVNKPWRSRWFSEREFDKLLVEDVKLKAELREKLKASARLRSSGRATSSAS